MGVARLRTASAFICASLLLSSSAAAQVFGTFSWQMQPYCNVVTLTLTSSPAGFSLDGTDNQCGAVNKASAVGVASFNGFGLVTINLTIVNGPSGRASHVSAIVSPANGEGTWSDSAGRSGTFKFFGNDAGLPVRPVPAQTAFVFQVTAGNVCSTGNSFAVIDHGLINNDPTAIVLLTPNATWPGSGTTGAYVANSNSQFEVSFWNSPNCPGQIPAGQGRWLVRRLDGSAIAVNAKFSVSAFAQ